LFYELSWVPVSALVPIGLAILIGFVGVFLIVRFYRLAWQAPVHRRYLWVILTGVVFSLVSWSITGLFALGLTRVDILGASGFDPLLLTAHLVLAPVAFIPATQLRLFPRAYWERVLAGAILGGLLFLSGILAIASLNIPGEKDVLPWGLVLATAWCVLTMGFLAGSFDGESPSARKWIAGTVALVNLMILLAIMSVALDFDYEPGASVPPDTIPGRAFIIIVMGFCTIMALTIFLFSALSRMTGHDMMLDYRTIATHDYLTGLPNRLYLQDNVSAQLSRKAGSGICLVGFDLDSFKPINDSYGHATGDMVLKTISERILGVLREGEYCARIGGDEFVAVKSTSSLQEALDLAERLLSAVMFPMEHGHGDIILTASFGVVVDPSRDITLKELLSRMDLALHHSKTDPSGNIRLYDDAMRVERDQKQSLEKDLADAIKNDHLELHYQPQYDLKTGSPVALEALVRWFHPRRGFMSPKDFIPLAEESGIIHDLGMWCIDRACQDRIEFGWTIPVAVNVSPQEFANPYFAGSVASVLRRNGFPGNGLELELTEFSPVQRGEFVYKNMDDLRELGVAITLDDYGAGHASLGTLKAFPFGKLKVDRDYILSLKSDPSSARIIRSVLLLGSALGIPVVVEGVETAAHEAFLKSEACEIGQGYWFARPAPASELKNIPCGTSVASGWDAAHRS